MHFNSILVRLKQLQIVLIPPSLLTFQFHSGTIKACKDELDELES